MRPRPRARDGDGWRDRRREDLDLERRHRRFLRRLLPPARGGRARLSAPSSSRRTTPGLTVAERIDVIAPHPLGHGRASTAAACRPERWSASRARGSRSRSARSTSSAPRWAPRRSASPAARWTRRVGHAASRQRVRQAARRLPAHPGAARRHGAATSTPRALLVYRAAWTRDAGRRARHARGRHGQALRHRGGAARDRRRRAAPRRARRASPARRSSSSTARSARCASTKGPARSSGSSSPARCCDGGRSGGRRRWPTTRPRGHLLPRPPAAAASCGRRCDYDGLPELRLSRRASTAPSSCSTRMVDAGCGDRTVFHFPGGRWTYRQLLETANRIAHVLVEDLGLVPGNRVLLRGPNNPMMAACWFAVLKAGGVVVCTMPLLRVRELTFIADKAQIRLALDRRPDRRRVRAGHGRPRRRLPARGRARRPLPRRAARLARVADARASPRRSTTCDTAADDMALIAFTSGTTGQGKGTMHFHRDVLAICDCFPRYVLQADPDDIFCGSPPLAFTFGLGGLLLFPMRDRRLGAAAGAGHAAAAPPGHPGLPRHRLLHRADGLPRDGRPGEGLRHLEPRASASRPARPCRWRPSRRGSGRPASRSSTASARPRCCTSSSARRATTSARARPARSSPATRRSVVDDDGNEVPAGTVGRLAVRGPTGCRYLDNLERQRGYVQDGWNLTGDSYLRDEDGYFWYQARTDDMIISAGYNISGPEVESGPARPSRGGRSAASSECRTRSAARSSRPSSCCARLRAEPGAGQGAAGLRQGARSRPTSTRARSSSSTRCRAPQTGKLQRFRLRETAMSEASRSCSPPGWAPPSGYANGIAADGPPRLRRRPDRLESGDLPVRDRRLRRADRADAAQRRRRPARGRRRAAAPRAAHLVHHRQGRLPGSTRRRSAAPTAR